VRLGSLAYESDRLARIECGIGHANARNRHSDPNQIVVVEIEEDFARVHVSIFPSPLTRFHYSTEIGY